MEIATSGIQEVLRISRFSTISTPAGTKKKAIYFEKKPALSSICSVFTIPTASKIRRMNIAINVPGNVNGRIYEIASPRSVMTKRKANCNRILMVLNSSFRGRVCHYKKAKNRGGLPPRFHIPIFFMKRRILSIVRLISLFALSLASL